MFLIYFYLKKNFLKKVYFPVNENELKTLLIYEKCKDKYLRENKPLHV